MALTPDRLTALFDRAAETQAAADACAKALAQTLTTALRRLVPVGTIVDLRERNLPAFLATLKTTHGADRGTRIFRIVEVNGVTVRANTPTISQWGCEAVPISETTGQDMRATAGNSRSGARATVSMSGYLSQDYPNETLEAEMNRLIQTLTGPPYVAPARPSVTPTGSPKAPRRPRNPR
jgi:hypothetical protein